MSSLGDVLLTTPLIRILRKKYPNAEIDFLVRPEYSELLRHNPHVTNLLLYDIREGFPGLQKLKRKLRSENYHVLLDLHRNLRSIYLRLRTPFSPFSNAKIYRIKKNQIIRFLLVKLKINLYRKIYGSPIPVWKKYILAAKPLGLEPDGQGLEFFLPPELSNIIPTQINELPPGNWKVVMAPGARHFTKRWLPEYFAELIRRLHQSYGLKTILVGGPEDVAVTNNILQLLPDQIAASFAAKLSISETASVIKNAALVISNDSGLMHVASAFNRPLIAIFGSTVEELGFFPYSSKAVVLENEGLYCRPCSHIGRGSCPEKHFRCMKEITPQMVSEKISEMEFL